MLTKHKLPSVRNGRCLTFWVWVLMTRCCAQQSNFTTDFILNSGTILAFLQSAGFRGTSRTTQVSAESARSTSSADLLINERKHSVHRRLLICYDEEAWNVQLSREFVGQSESILHRNQFMHRVRGSFNAGVAKLTQ